MEGTKYERFLPKNQQTQRKLLNFENWVNGEVSKLGIVIHPPEIDHFMPKKVKGV